MASTSRDEILRSLRSHGRACKCKQCVINTAEGGQVYIYSTVDGSAISNQYVTVTGTAYDVAYMDAITDTNNTVY